MKNIVFTGHREVLDGHAELIESAVASLIKDAGHFIVGGALGADTIALNYMCHAVSIGSTCKPIVVLPDYVRTVPLGARNIVHKSIEYGADIIELGQGYSAESLKARNRAMVDKAVTLGEPEMLAYWREIFRSGTWSAMSYAKKSNVHINYVPVGM